MELNVGILMIGSLYWDEGRRRDWRTSRLAPDDALTVTVPIRYGRRSSPRASTYTTVFSAGCPLGTGRVVPCKNLISSADEFIAEAEHLWKAERLSDRASHQISATWGCVAVMVHPNRQLPKSVLSSWANHVRPVQDYGRVPQLEGQAPLVSDEGILQLPWPEVVNQDSTTELPLDLLLTTVTHPTFEGEPPQYASVEAIARGWGNDPGDELRTFRNNRAHGIRTFQDDAILEELHSHFPAKASSLI